MLIGSSIMHVVSAAHAFVEQTNWEERCFLKLEFTFCLLNEKYNPSRHIPEIIFQLNHSFVCSTNAQGPAKYRVLLVNSVGDIKKHKNNAFL